MKSIIITLALLLGLTTLTQAQEVVSKKALDVKSRSVELVQLDEEAQQITIVFRTKLRNKSMDVLQNTYSTEDLSLIKSEERNVDRSRYKELGYASGLVGGDGVVRLLRADNNIRNQFSLKRGYLERRRFGRSYITAFQAEETVKPKGVDGDKMSMVMYVTDFPRITNPFGGGFQGQNNLSFGTGNVTVFMYEKEKPHFTKYHIGRWDAQNMQKIGGREIALDEPYFPISAQQLEGNAMGLIFATVDQGEKLLYLKLDKEGNELERIEIPLAVAGNHNLNIAEDEYGTHINGLTDQGEKLQIVSVGEIVTMAAFANKFDGNRMGYTQPDHLTMITIKDGEVVYKDQSPVRTHLETAVTLPEEKVKLPKVDKAEKEFKWNKMGYNTFVSTSDQDKTFILGQDYNKELHFVAQYDRNSGLEKTYFKTRELPIAPNQLLHLANGKLIWFLGEEDVEKGDSKTSILAIDPATGNATEWYTLEKKYYPSPVSYINFMDDGNSAILIELHEKGKTVNLTKVAF